LLKKSPLNQAQEASKSETDSDFSLESLLASLGKKEQVIQQKSTVIAEQKKRIEILEEYLRLERNRRFTPSSEKNSPQEEMQFDEAESLAEQEEQPAEESSKSPSKKQGGRKGLSPKLPRIQIHLTLSEEDKEGAVDTFFTVVKEELDIIPAQVRVLEYLQEKAVFINQEKERKIKAAKLPKHPLNKCIASISMLAFIIISKYCDGLPLYRLEGIVKRYGGSITRTSLATWMIRVALELQPLINLMREHQLAYDYLQIDETRIKVLKEADKSPTSDKWMWVSRGGPPDKPVILFDYDPSRGKEVPARLLEGFKGYLQCDGLASYDEVCKLNDLTQLGCMDHARRKFVEAQKGVDPKKKKKTSLADVAVNKIGKLYAIERKIKDLSTEEKYRYRQEHSVPKLNDLKSWLDKSITKVPKKGLTYKAIYYALNQWKKLIAYCEDGRLNISNILAENAIRPFVIGRKAWLFSDTTRGAKASGTLYSLIETVKANGLEPFQYFKEVLSKLPYAENVEDFEALLPWNVNIRG